MADLGGIFLDILTRLNIPSVNRTLREAQSLMREGGARSSAAFAEGFRLDPAMAQFKRLVAASDDAYRQMQIGLADLQVAEARINDLRVRGFQSASQAMVAAQREVDAAIANTSRLIAASNATQLEAQAARGAAVVGGRHAAEEDRGRETVAPVPRGGMSRAANIVGGGATLALGGFLGEGLKHEVKIDDLINQIQAQQHMSADDRRLMTQSLWDIARDTGFKPEELAKNYGQVARATDYNTGKNYQGQAAVDLMRNAAMLNRISGQGSLEESIQAVSTTSHDYRIPVEKAAGLLSRGYAGNKGNAEDYEKSLHSIEPIASMMGIDPVEIFAALDQMSQTGQTAQQSAPNLKNLLQNLGGPGPTQSHKLGQIGLNPQGMAADLTKNGLAGTLQLVRDAIAKNLGKDGNLHLEYAYQNAMVEDQQKEVFDKLSPAAQQLVSLPAFQKSEVSPFRARSMFTTPDGQKKLREMGGGDIDTNSITLDDFGGIDQYLKKQQLLHSPNSAIRSDSPEVMNATAAATQLAGGKDAGRTLIMLAGSQPVLDQYKQRENDFKTGATPEALQADFEKSMSDAAKKLLKFSASLESLEAQAGQHLLPMFSHVVDKFNGFMNFLDKVPGAGQVLLGAIGALAGAWSASKLVKIFEDLSGPLGSVMNAARNMGEMLSNRLPTQVAVAGAAAEELAAAETAGAAEITTAATTTSGEITAAGATAGEEIAAAGTGVAGPLDTAAVAAGGEIQAGGAKLGAALSAAGPVAVAEIEGEAGAAGAAAAIRGGGAALGGALAGITSGAILEAIIGLYAGKMISDSTSMSAALANPPGPTIDWNNIPDGVRVPSPGDRLRRDHPVPLDPRVPTYVPGWDNAAPPGLPQMPVNQYWQKPGQPPMLRAPGKDGKLPGGAKGGVIGKTIGYSGGGVAGQPLMGYPDMGGDSLIGFVQNADNPVMLRGGEGILTPEAVAALGGASVVDKINSGKTDNPWDASNHPATKMLSSFAEGVQKYSPWGKYLTAATSGLEARDKASDEAAKENLKGQKEELREEKGEARGEKAMDRALKSEYDEALGLKKPRGSAGTMAAIERAYLESGFPASQFGDLRYILSHESGFNPNARNPSSGAYGLGQFLGHEHDKYGAMGAYSGDPYAESQAMLAYIRDRYGSPANAAAFWKGHNWYSKGGVIKGYNTGGTLPGKGVSNPFTDEGEQYYKRAYRQYSQYATSGPYATSLTGQEESQFRNWVKANNINFDPNEKISDYDMRGYWRDDPGASSYQGGHFPDTYKTPYDTSFSGESKYALPNSPLKWHGNNLVNESSGKLMFAPPEHYSKGGVIAGYSGGTGGLFPQAPFVGPGAPGPSVPGAPGGPGGAAPVVPHGQAPAKSPGPQHDSTFAPPPAPAEHKPDASKSSSGVSPSMAKSLLNLNAGLSGGQPFPKADEDHTGTFENPSRQEGMNNTSKGFQAGGGLLGMAEQAITAAAAATPAGPAGSMAAQSAFQLVNRAIGFGGQLVGIGLEGLLGTFLPNNSALADPSNSLFGKVALGIAGAHPSPANSAGKSAMQLTPKEDGKSEKGGSSGGVTINGDVHNHGQQQMDGFEKELAKANFGGVPVAGQP